MGKSTNGVNEVRLCIKVMQFSMMMSCVMVMMVMVYFSDLLEASISKSTVEHIIVLYFMTKEVNVPLAMKLVWIMMIINSIMSLRVVDYCSD